MYKAKWHKARQRMTMSCNQNNSQGSQKTVKRSSSNQANWKSLGDQLEHSVKAPEELYLSHGLNNLCNKAYSGTALGKLKSRS